jgi:hypothetical protein
MFTFVSEDLVDIMVEAMAPGEGVGHVNPQEDLAQFMVDHGVGGGIIRILRQVLWLIVSVAHLLYYVRFFIG